MIIELHIKSYVKVFKLNDFVKLLHTYKIIYFKSTLATGSLLDSYQNKLQMNHHCNHFRRLVGISTEVQN